MMTFPLYPEYKSTGYKWMPSVPAGWRQVPFKHACLRFALYGANLSSDEYIQGGVRFLRTTDIKENGELEDDGVYVRHELAKDFLLSDGDILLSRSGTIGRAFVYSSNEHAECAYAGYLVRFIPSIELNPKWFFYFSKSSAFKDWLSTQLICSTIGNVNGQKYAQCPLALPTVEEQEDIVAFLDRETGEIDSLIDEQQRFLNLLQEQIESLVLSSINAKETKSIRLENAANLITRPLRQQQQEAYTRIGLYNRGRGIFHKDASEMDEMGDSDFYWVEEGDLIISGQFAWEGAVAMAGRAEAGCVVSHRYPVLRGKDNIALTEYIFAFLGTHLGDFLLNEHSRGAAGRNRPLNIRSLFKEKIPVPSIETQEIVAKAVYARDAVLKEIKITTELLNERRTTLISAAVTGQINVRSLTKN
jgi:type I restriction enzyme S subunit